MPRGHQYAGVTPYCLVRGSVRADLIPAVHGRLWRSDSAAPPAQPRFGPETALSGPNAPRRAGGDGCGPRKAEIAALGGHTAAFQGARRAAVPGGPGPSDNAQTVNFGSEGGTVLCGRGVSTAPREKESPASLLSAASERKLAGPQERLIIFYCVNVGPAASAASSFQRDTAAGGLRAPRPGRSSG